MAHAVQQPREQLAKRAAASGTGSGGRADGAGVGGEAVGGRGRSTHESLALVVWMMVTGVAGGAGVRAGAPLDPQLQRFPVDRSHDLERQQRMGDEDAQQCAVAEWTAPGIEPRMQHRAAGVVRAHADDQPLPVRSRRLDAEAVAHLESEEGGDVEALVALLRDQVAAGFGGVDRDQVAVALAEGVVDLVQDRLQRTVRTVAEIDRQRIEDMAQDARHAQQADRAARAEARPRRAADRRRAQAAAVAVVALVQAEQVEAIDREDPQPPIEHRPVRPRPPGARTSGSRSRCRTGRSRWCITRPT